MHVRMVQDEVRQAIREYFEKRGIDIPKNEIEFRIKAQFSNVTSRSIHPGDIVEGDVWADIIGVELPIKEGPYR